MRCTGTAPATMLILAMPGTGFVGLITEMATPAEQRILPIPTAPDIERLITLCAQYKIDILGPLPEGIDEKLATGAPQSPKVDLE